MLTHEASSSREFQRQQLLNASLHLATAIADVSDDTRRRLPADELAAALRLLRSKAGTEPLFTAQQLSTACWLLVQCLACSSRSVRKATAKLLEILVNGCGQQVMLPHVNQLLDFLHHADWGVRCTALELLRCIPQAIDDRISMRLVLQLRSPDWGTRQMALQALGCLDNEAVIAVAGQMLAILEGLDWEVRRGALRILAELKPGSLSPLASTIYNMRTSMGQEVEYLLRPAAAWTISVPYNSESEMLGL